MEEEILPSLLTSFSSTRAYAPLLLRSTQLTWDLQQRLMGEYEGKNKRFKNIFLIIFKKY